jgi:hypothetical protein
MLHSFSSPEANRRRSLGEGYYQVEKSLSLLVCISRRPILNYIPYPVVLPTDCRLLCQARTALYNLGIGKYADIKQPV